jgi:hypothetical protein
MPSHKLISARKLLSAIFYSAVCLPVNSFAFSAPDKAFSFSLHLQRAETTLSYDSQQVDITTERIGIAMVDLDNPRLNLGFSLGQAYVSQADNPETAGLSLSGFYFGLLFRNILFDTPKLSSTLDTRYLFQHVSDENQGKNLTLEWHEFGFQLTVLAKFYSWMDLYGGFDYGLLDGSERITGANARTTNLKHDPGSGGFVGLRIKVDRGGYIGFEIQNTTANTTTIFFERRYDFF